VINYFDIPFELVFGNYFLDVVPPLLFFFVCVSFCLGNQTSVTIITHNKNDRQSALTDIVLGNSAPQLISRNVSVRQ